MSSHKEILDKLGAPKYRDVDILRVAYPKGSVVLIIDMDTLMFRVASACQRNFIKVTNPQGKSREFKHRTAFREYCEEKNVNYDDFIIEDKVEAEHVKNCLAVLKKSVEKLKREFKITHIEMYHGGKGNFRSVLPLIEEYKGQRSEIKPVHLPDCVKYAEDVLGSKCVIGVETDDIVQMRWLDCTKLDGVTCYLATVDKDAKQVYQSEKEFLIINLASFEVERFKGGLGELHTNSRGEVKGTGLKWLVFQLMQGDAVDNYAQKKLFKKRYGEKSFLKDFNDLDTPKQVLEKHVEVTKRLLPEVVEYTTWDGKEVKMSWLEVQELYWSCAYMRVNPNDKTTFESLLKEYGVEY